jgi:hypothetical protein
MREDRPPRILLGSGGARPLDLHHLEVFLRAPHSGQVQFIGTSSQRVPAAMPSSGRPAASS